MQNNDIAELMQLLYSGVFFFPIKDYTIIVTDDGKSQIIKHITE